MSENPDVCHKPLAIIHFPPRAGWRLPANPVSV